MSLFDRGIDPTIEGMNDITGNLYRVNYFYFKRMVRDFCNQTAGKLSLTIEKSDFYKELQTIGNQENRLISEELLDEFRLSLQGILEDYFTEDKLKEIAKSSVMEDLRNYKYGESKPKRKSGWIFRLLKDKKVNDQPMRNK